MKHCYLWNSKQYEFVKSYLQSCETKIKFLWILLFISIEKVNLRLFAPSFMFAILCCPLNFLDRLLGCSIQWYKWLAKSLLSRKSVMVQASMNFWKTVLCLLIYIHTHSYVGMVSCLSGVWHFFWYVPTWTTFHIHCVLSFN